MKKTGIVVLVIVLVLVVAAELFLLVQLKSGGLTGIVQRFTGERTAETADAGGMPAVDSSPEMTQAPPPTMAPAVDTPVPTVVPATPEPPPTAAPVTPTPIPTAEPTPTAAPSSEGSCASNTGTALNLNVDWRTEDLGNGNTRVYVTGRITSYSLDLGGTSATVTVGGQSTTCAVGSLYVAEGNATVSDLFSVTLDVPSGNTWPLRVDWNARVTYSGVQLDTITAEGSVTA